MNTSTSTSLPAPTPAPGRSIAAWWQAMPLTLVFVLFFLVPLALIGDGQLLGFQ
jgi:putative spermidine/putrescine transport system permease protein